MIEAAYGVFHTDYVRGLIHGMYVGAVVVNAIWIIAVQRRNRTAKLESEP